MKGRAGKIDRILDVQRKMYKLSEAKLFELQASRRALDDEQVKLIHALNGHDLLQGLFLDATSKRLRKIATQGATLDEASRVQQALTIDKAIKLKAIEKLAAGIVVQNQREADRNALFDLIEAAVEEP